MGKRNNMLYDKLVIALIGDIVSSRKIENRIEFDKTLLRTLKEINADNEAIISKFTLIGDELQVIYKNANGIFLDAIKILSTTYPEKVRFSWGIGKLIKEINPEQAIETDGPAFYCARDGIFYLKEEKELLRITSNENNQELELIRNILSYVSQDIVEWNELRYKILIDYQKEMRIKDIAKKHKIHKVSVYKNIRAGKLGLILSILNQAEQMINKEWNFNG